MDSLLPAPLRRRFHDLAGGLPPTFWYVWVGSLVNRLGGFVVPFLALYLTRERGMTAAQAGLIVSLYGVGSVGAGPVGGFLTDRVGRRATLVGGLLLGSLGMTVLGFARTPLQITVAATVLGFVAELFRPAVSALVADVVPPEDRARAYGLIYWAVNLGFSIAPVLAGLMARVSYLALFLGDAATTLLYALIVWLKVPETRPALPVEQRSQLTKPGSTLVAFQDPVFLAFFVLTFFTACLFFQSTMTLPVTMGAHGVAPGQFGLLIAVNGVLIVFLQPLAAPLVARFRRSRVLSLSAALVGVGFGLTGFVTTPALYAVSIAIWTFGEIIQAGSGLAVVAELAPPQLLGRYQGAFHMSWALAAFAGPAGGGWLLEHQGEQTLFGGCLVLGLAVSVGHLAIAGPRRRRLTLLRQALSGGASMTLE